MSDILRQKFEAKNPVPEFLHWSDEHGCYMPNENEQISDAIRYQAKWEGYEMGYPDAVRDCADACKKVLKDGDGMTIGVGVCIDAIEELAP